ncbi:retrovirus-related pol polyprotein from transposon TNT 1-94 [Tanacetum coccineum]
MGPPLRVDLEPDEWIKDSGCSKNMTGNQKLFSTYKAYNGTFVRHGYYSHFSAPYTPQSNGVVERKNRTLQEMSRTMLNQKIKESLNVIFNETTLPSKTSPLVDDDLDEEEAITEIKKKNLENVVEDETLEIDEIVNIKESRKHPLEMFIGNLKH